jgi:hypothetical protein
MIDKSFKLLLRDGDDFQDVKFDRKDGDLLSQVDLAMRLLWKFKKGVIEDELHKPLYMSIVPEDQQEENQHRGETEYQNPLNDPSFGVSIELGADDGDPDIPS